MRRMFNNAFSSTTVSNSPSLTSLAASATGDPPSASAPSRMPDHFRTETGSTTLNGHDTDDETLRSGRTGRSRYTGGLDGVDEDEDEFAPERLPFGRRNVSNVLQPAADPTRVSTASSAGLAYDRDGSSDETENRDNTRTTIQSSSMGDAKSTKAMSAKEEMLLQLLAGQAAVEAKDFRMLDFDQVESLKQVCHTTRCGTDGRSDAAQQEHKRLLVRIQNTKHKLAIEQRIRDATFLVSHTSPSSTDDLAPADQRLASIRSELDDLRTQEQSSREKLLQHLAAALSALVKRHEESSFPQEVADASSVADTSFRSRATADRSLTPASSAGAFDGPHFFANNRDAFAPISLLGRSLAPSGPNSPLRRGRTASVEPQGVPHAVHASVAAQLEEAQRNVQEHRTELEETRAQVNDHKILLSSARADADRLRQEADSHSSSANDYRDRHEDAVARLREAEDRAHEAEAKNAELQIRVDELRGNGEKAKSERTKEIEEMRAQVRALEAKCREAEDRAAASEKTAVDLKADLSRFKEKTLRDVEGAKLLAADELRRADADLSQQRAASDQQWKDLKHALAAVGTKHHDPDLPLGWALVDLPSQKDDPSTLAEKLSGAINEHFDRVKSQRNKYQTDLEASKRALADHQQASEEDVQRATEERAIALRESSAQRARAEALEQELEELEAKFADAHGAASGIAALQEELDRQRTDAAHAEAEVVTLSSQVQELRTAIANQEAAAQRPLKELFKLLPAGGLEGRAGVADDADLATYRKAFDPAKKSLGGILGYGRRAGSTSTVDAATGADEFSMQAFFERVKALAESDRKLVDRLIKHEGEREGHKLNATRAQKLVEESQGALRTYQQQVR